MQMKMGQSGDEWSVRPAGHELLYVSGMPVLVVTVEATGPQGETVKGNVAYCDPRAEAMAAHLSGGGSVYLDLETDIRKEASGLVIGHSHINRLSLIVPKSQAPGMGQG